MMSESVTVTMQNGNEANRGTSGQPRPFNLNVDYFRSAPGLVKIIQIEKSDKGNGEENSSASKELSEEEIQFQEKKIREWEKLVDFLNSHAEEMIDTVSFNAVTNFYVNDVAALRKNEAIFTEHVCDNYEEKASLVDLKRTSDKCLLAASWHSEKHDIIVCVYLNQNGESSSLILLWSLLNPLEPKLILRCESKITSISFCPLKNYSNIIVGGCADGKIIIWELVNDWLLEKNDKPETGSDIPIKEATLAVSGEKSQTLSITSIQWLPSWCHIETDGNYQKVSTDSPKEPKPYFATASADGTVFFWSLPRTLSTPAKVRSPLHLTISPIYQLVFEESDEKRIKSPIKVASFCLPLARNEESSSLNIRDQSDLERLRKIFIGTSKGEVICYTWDGQTFSPTPADRELCRILTRCSVHDGVVRTMVKSPNLDDVFLSVGGRSFALWKENFPKSPVFQRRLNNCRYGEACWSGRAGRLVVTRLDGCFEVWDLKEKSYEPILLQTISDKITPYVYSSPSDCHNKLIAVLDGSSNLRIFMEPDETADDEDLERVEWLEEFAWRETRRKIDFYRWQDDYLRHHPVALKRKAEREQAEVTRKHQEAREKFLRILGIICISLGSPSYGGGIFYIFVAVTAFVLSIVWAMIYLFSVREALRLPINWILTELLNTGLYTVLYLAASSIELALFSRPSYIAAGILGLINTLAYAAGTYYLYLEHIGSQH